MKKVLYISNIEVPYRVRYFNELSKYCDLTVIYERRNSSNRDTAWTKSEKNQYRKYYLDGKNVGNENSFSLRITTYLNKEWDAIILGCFNSPVQVFANLYLKARKIPFVINLDGEIFAGKNGFKSSLKRCLLNNGSKYLVAGKKAANSLRNIVGNTKIINTYYFSSLSSNEIKSHSSDCWLNYHKSNLANGGGPSVLVVGQYFPYKGLDVAVEAAKLLPNIKFKFVGTGNRTDLFTAEQNINDISNITVVPYLQKEALEKEYKLCDLVVLPSRQECWGLVINEAASFGTPIVSTTGSGAAVEFLYDKYPFLLAAPGDSKSLADAISLALCISDIQAYSNYLINKSRKYVIEESVQNTLKII